MSLTLKSIEGDFSITSKGEKPVIKGIGCVMKHNNNQKPANTFFECPFCICNFSTQTDLDCHLEAYGTNKTKHLHQLNTTHKKTDPSFRGSMAKSSKSTNSNKKSRFRRY